MRRRIVAGIAATGLLAAVVVPGSPAAASGTGSSYSAVAKVAQGTGLTTTTSTTGLLSILSPVLSSVVNPLVSAVTALPGQLLADLAGALTGAGLQASNPGSQQTAPVSGYPASCHAGGWTSADCYGPVVPALSVPPLVVLSSGTAQGFATGDTTGYTARAQVSDPNITLLGLAIGDLGVVQSSSFCPTTGTCTETQTLTGVSLLGGLIRAKIATGTNLFQISVNNGPYTTITSLTSSLNSYSGLNVTTTANGNLLSVKIGIGLTQLLTGLGLGNLLSGVSGLVDAGSTVNLTLTIGPGSSSSTGTVQGWGLEVGVDLSGSINLSVLGLAGVTITIPTGVSSSTYGDLLDLKLAYTNATAGTALTTGPQWIPPGLI